MRPHLSSAAVLASSALALVYALAACGGENAHPISNASSSLILPPLATPCVQATPGPIVTLQTPAMGSSGVPIDVGSIVVSWNISGATAAGVSLTSATAPMVIGATLLPAIPPGPAVSKIPTLQRSTTYAVIVKGWEFSDLPSGCQIPFGGQIGTFTTEP